MATQHSNHYFAQLHRGLIDFTSHTFKIILMNSSFTAFNPDTHATYADVSTYELTTANGYTQNTKTLSGLDVSGIEDDTNDRSQIAWADAQWTASGGNIGPALGAIIFDDTTSDDTVVGYIDFGSAQTATSGGTFTVANITVRLGHAS